VHERELTPFPCLSPGKNQTLSRSQQHALAEIVPLLEIPHASTGITAVVVVSDRPKRVAWFDHVRAAVTGCARGVGQSSPKGSQNKNNCD